MDVKNKKILFEMSQNSRISLKELAKKVGLNENTTLYRLKKLEKNEVILGTHAIIDNTLLGFLGFRVYIKFKGTTAEKEKEITEWLKKQDEAHVITINTGFVDCLVISWVKHTIDFHEFIHKFKEHYKDHSEILEISPYVRAHHFNRNYLVEKGNNKVITIGNEKEVNFDDLDTDILKLLSQNARLSSLEISKKLQVQSRTIIERIKKLEKKEIIKGYSINLNIEKIGYEYHKLNIIFEKNIKYPQLISYSSNIKNTLFIDETTSKYDYELNLEVKDYAELEGIINKIKEDFKGIKELQMFRLKRFEKFVYIPENVKG